MDERMVQFRVGMMVLATFLIAVILVISLGEWPSLFVKSYTVYIKFTDAPGVSPKSPISKSGQHIGRVDEIELLDEGGVLVTARIDADQKVFRDEFCRIYTSLLGDSDLRFVRSEGAAEIREGQREAVQDGDTLTGVVAVDPIEVVDKLQERLSEAIDSIASTSGDVGEAARRISELLDANDEHVDSIVATTDEMIQILQQTIENINDVVGDPEVKSQLKESVAAVPQLIADAQAILGQFDGTIAIANTSLQHIEGFTERLGTDGPEMLAGLERSARNLEMAMEHVAELTRAINEQKGTVGRLIHDDELYNNLNGAVANIQLLSEQLKPVVYDARVFSDKIARHPELLGVRGAIKGSPGTKGVPTRTSYQSYQPY